jgi:hypothetical protein
MGRASSTHGRNKKYLRMLVGKPEGKRSLVGPRRSWEDGINRTFEKDVVKAKVKLSLCLTKHHAMTVYLLGSGGIAPRTL